MIKAPRGTHDILPSESYRWHGVEEQKRKIEEAKTMLICGNLDNETYETIHAMMEDDMKKLNEMEGGNR